MEPNSDKRPKKRKLKMEMKKNETDVIELIILDSDDDDNDEGQSPSSSSSTVASSTSKVATITGPSSSTSRASTSRASTSRSSTSRASTSRTSTSRTSTSSPALPSIPSVLPSPEVIDYSTWRKLDADTYILTASRHQGHTEFKNPGVQCVAMCACAVVQYHHIAMSEWTRERALDPILDNGDALYTESWNLNRGKSTSRYLLISQLKRRSTLFGQRTVFSFLRESPLYGSIFDQATLLGDLAFLFTKCNYAIVISGRSARTVMIRGPYYYLFDPHSINPQGETVSGDEGRATIFLFLTVEKLTEMLSKMMINSGGHSRRTTSTSGDTTPTSDDVNQKELEAVQYTIDPIRVHFPDFQQDMNPKVYEEYMRNSRRGNGNGGNSGCMKHEDTPPVKDEGVNDETMIEDFEDEDICKCEDEDICKCEDEDICKCEDDENWIEEDGSFNGSDYEVPDEDEESSDEESSDEESTNEEDDDLVEEDSDSEDEDEDCAPPSKRHRASRPTTTSNDDDDDADRGMRFFMVSIKCPQLDCGKQFDSVAHLNAHLWEKHSIRLFRCLVKGCGESFDNRTALGQHRAQSHGDTSQWHCCKCASSFTAYRYLYAHYCSMHQTGVYRCSSRGCTFTGGNSTQMQHHYSRVHKPARKIWHQCPHCRHRTLYSSNLITHMRTHSRIRPYRCKWSGCDYAATLRADTLRHIRNVHLVQRSDSNEAQLGQAEDYLEVVRV